MKLMLEILIRIFNTIGIGYSEEPLDEYCFMIDSSVTEPATGYNRHQIVVAISLPTYKDYVEKFNPQFLRALNIEFGVVNYGWDSITKSATFTLFREQDRETF